MFNKIQVVDAPRLLHYLPISGNAFDLPDIRGPCQRFFSNNILVLPETLPVPSNLITSGYWSFFQICFWARCWLQETLIINVSILSYPASTYHKSPPAKLNSFFIRRNVVSSPPNLDHYLISDPSLNGMFNWFITSNCQWAGIHASAKERKLPLWHFRKPRLCRDRILHLSLSWLVILKKGTFNVL